MLLSNYVIKSWWFWGCIYIQYILAEMSARILTSKEKTNKTLPANQTSPTFQWKGHLDTDGQEHYRVIIRKESRSDQENEKASHRLGESTLCQTLCHTCLVKECHLKCKKKKFKSTIKKQPNWKVRSEQKPHQDKQMANEHKKGCLASWVTKEMQIKTMRHCSTLTRTAQIWNTANTKCWRGCGATGTLTDGWWGCSMVQACGKAS